MPPAARCLRRLSLPRAHSRPSLSLSLSPSPVCHAARNLHHQRRLNTLEYHDALRGEEAHDGLISSGQAYNGPVDHGIPPEEPGRREELDFHTLMELATAEIEPEHQDTVSNDPKQFNYHALFPDALRQAEVTTVLKCLAAGAYDVDFIRSIPATSFGEIVSLFDAYRMVEMDAEAMEHFPREKRGSMEITPPAQTVDKFLRAISTIVTIRRNAGMRLGLREYTHLLSCAAKAGDSMVAERLWRKMHEDGVVPDTACYNARMAAMIWNGIHTPRAAAALRVTAWQLRERVESQRHFRIGQGGLEDQVKTLFSQMLDAGVLGNEETFKQMIIAFSREGHLAAITSILHRVWGIDADALLRTGVDPPAPLRIPPTSPLYPTPDLMLALVHAFGSNNAVHTALVLVDYIHRTYHLPITAYVWQELYRWTCVLARRRAGPRGNDQKEGQLSMATPERLWHRMQQPPYSFRPTILMHHFGIRALLDVQRMRAAKQLILSGKALYTASVRAADAAARKLERARARVERGAVQRGALAKMADDARVLGVAKHRNHMLLRKWCTQWLWKGNARRGRNWNRDWLVCQVPDFIAELGTFCSSRVWVRVGDGSVLAISQRSGVEGPVSKLRKEKLDGGKKVRIGTGRLRWWRRGPDLGKGVLVRALSARKRELTRWSELKGRTVRVKARQQRVETPLGNDHRAEPQGFVPPLEDHARLDAYGAPATYRDVPPEARVVVGSGWDRPRPGSGPRT